MKKNSERIKKEAWATFFQYERLFLDEVQDHLYCLYHNKDAPPEYSSNKEGFITKPPKYIRYIGRCKNIPSQEYIKKRIAKLQQLYRKALGNKFKSYPHRFPEFIEDVEQINISSHEAYSSYKLIPDTTIVYIMYTMEYTLAPKTSDVHSINRDNFNLRVEENKKITQTLNEFGIEAEHNIKYLGILPSSLVTFPSNSLFNKFKVNHIQCRIRTGNQYRAVIRKQGMSAGDRRKLGFYILNADSEPNIVFANKQGDRPHSLKALKKQLILPVDGDIEFYNKD